MDPEGKRKAIEWATAGLILVAVAALLWPTSQACPDNASPELLGYAQPRSDAKRDKSESSSLLRLLLGLNVLLYAMFALALSCDFALLRGMPFPVAMAVMTTGFWLVAYHHYCISVEASPMVLMLSACLGFWVVSMHMTYHAFLLLPHLGDL